MLRFTEDPELCPVEALVCYHNQVFTMHLMYNVYYYPCFKVSLLNTTRSAFFVSYCTPFACVSTQSLTRWTIFLLEAAGVDTAVWKSHAMRSASALHHRRSLSVLQIHRRADWSTAGGVFRTFYEKFL